MFKFLTNNAAYLFLLIANLPMISRVTTGVNTIFKNKNQKKLAYFMLKMCKFVFFDI